MVERATELVVIGNACVDLFIPPHDAPPPSGVVYIPPLGVEIGGNGANTAITAARLGTATAFAGQLGGDLFGRHVLAGLGEADVDISLVEVLDDVAAPTTVVLNDASGERSFVHHPGSNATYSLSEATLKAVRERDVSVFHFAAPQLLGQFFPEACADAMRELKKRGSTRLSFDVIDLGGDDMVRVHRPLLELVDMIFPNEEEARAISGRETIDEMLAYFLDCGLERVVIKQGGEGATIAWEGRREAIATEHVEVVDTCGAGDNFVGGFLTGLLRGLDPVDCARLGCATGTLCVGRKGAVAATADQNTVRELLGRFGLI